MSDIAFYVSVLLTPGPDSIYWGRKMSLGEPHTRRPCFPHDDGHIRPNQCQCHAHKRSTLFWPTEGSVCERPGVQRGRRDFLEEGAVSEVGGQSL